MLAAATFSEEGNYRLSCDSHGVSPSWSLLGRLRSWRIASRQGQPCTCGLASSRRQRVEDAERVGLQFPFRSERRGRGAPTFAMKWRDAVKAAIMHGPSATGRHSRCAALVATWNAAVATGGLHGASAAEAQTRHVCGAEDRAREASIHAHTRRGEAVVRGLPRLSSACPRQVARLQHSPGEAAGAGALRALVARHIPQMARQRRT